MCTHACVRAFLLKCCHAEVGSFLLLDGPRDRAQAIRLGSRHLCLLCSLPSPFFISSHTCWLDTCLLWRLIGFRICILWCFCIIFYLKFKFFRELERWLRGFDHWLLLQKTWIWFSAPTQRLITICNWSSKEFAALFWPPRTLNAGDPNTDMQGKHSHTWNKNKSFFLLVLNFQDRSLLDTVQVFESCSDHSNSSIFNSFFHCLPTLSIYSINSIQSNPSLKEALLHLSVSQGPLLPPIGQWIAYQWINSAMFA